MKFRTLLPFDSTTNLWVGSTLENTLDFAVTHWLACAIDAIDKHGLFTVALSGGSTPKKIYERIAKHADANRVDWSKVFFFFSDERSVPPTDNDSNYKMAITSGIGSLPISPVNLFRMEAEVDIEENAEKYEQLIYSHVPNHSFDLIMLGCGDDGHTASLFPNTDALKETKKLVSANFVLQKDTWRMTMTYPCLNQAKHLVVYALGEGKQAIIKELFVTHKGQKTYPSQRLGTPQNPVLWILDKDSALHV
ncbi:MAG: 6-phosphogluconolactonase [Chlamydiae bacterium]|nr:6-phosphogluconolactonase [Chlamydiota bacterium]